MRHQCPNCQQWHDAESTPIDWKAEHAALVERFKQLHSTLEKPRSRGVDSSRSAVVNMEIFMRPD